MRPARTRQEGSGREMRVSSDAATASVMHSPPGTRAKRNSASSQPRPGKRKASVSIPKNDNPSTTPTHSRVVIDLTTPSPSQKRPKREVYTPSKHAQQRNAADPVETRTRRFRPKAPNSFDNIYQRALNQRMFVLDRRRHPAPGSLDPDSPGNHPTETVTLAGTTGNIYHIRITKTPTCDCPHFVKGHDQCKHIVYVLARVLRAPDDLQYQLAFLSSELREIFATAPPLPIEQASSTSENDGNRRPVTGECPICCEDFDADGPPEEVVYCKDSCGNNVHKSCFQQWAATKRQEGEVTCPFCRAKWNGPLSDPRSLRGLADGGDGVLNHEGYVNVADQLGLSGHRDYSSYHQPWVRSRYRY